MGINEKENQSIKKLEEELIDAQRLEFNMRSDSGVNPVERIIGGYVAASSFYTDPKKIRNMIDELRATLDAYAKTAHKTGRLLAKKSLNRFLDESEARDVTQRKLRLINQATERQAQRRLSVSYLELEKEAGILSRDIQIFKQRSAIAGLKSKDILKNLVVAAKDKEGLTRGFAKRIKSINVAAARREKSAGEIAEYQKQVKVNEKWQWISISSKPCPDCEARAGRVMKLQEWRSLGIPGAGRTICGAYCRCKLIPFPVAEDLFPTVKVFDWNEKEQVLTTASEARRLRALKNQPPQKTRK